MNTYVVVDIETTGAHPLTSDIIEIGAVYVEKGRVAGEFNQLICPTQEISPYITSITGITNEMVQYEPPIETVMPKFINFCKDVPLVGHNIILFDYRMLKVKAINMGLPFDKMGLDTLVIARKMLHELPSRRLGDLCAHYHINLENAHRAYDDAFATHELYLHLKDEFYHIEPKLFEPLPMAWEIPKSVPLTKRQKAYLLNLCHRHQITLKQDIDALTKSQCSKLIDHIISEHGKI
ncbi:3'-5' exonuclease [Cellulosilyticum sp. I15G10I2]|uniref:3'-5' exonuclease n=1 Tax=Cellulosilyticum sp. I15G10I2 TaxID=1892843 RepID=UPI00085C5E85|nr:3'-5' exonuclease [Cellulosilyticum sp. I15G10I2]